MKRNHIAAILPIVAVFVFSLASCHEKKSVSQPETGLSTYDNSAYGIRINYPSGWAKGEQLMGAVVTFLSPKESATDIFQENLNVVVQDLSLHPMTLEEYTELSVGQLRRLITDLNIVDSSATTLAGSPAHKVICTGRQGIYDLKWMVVWTIKNNKAYVITYTAEVGKYSDFLDTANEMISSFEIKGK
jgi:serine/threonine-protein kinase